MGAAVGCARFGEVVVFGADVGGSCFGVAFVCVAAEPALGPESAPSGCSEIAGVLETERGLDVRLGRCLVTAGCFRVRVLGEEVRLLFESEDAALLGSAS